MFTDIKQLIQQIFIEPLCARHWGFHSKLYEQSLYPEGASIMMREISNKQMNTRNLMQQSEKYYEEKQSRGRG